MAKKVVCDFCGETFLMGYNGVVTDDDKSGCDLCLEICRDKNGFAWFPDETSQTYHPVGLPDDDSTQDYTVTRDEAFGIGGRT